MSFGTRLRERREQLGLKQSELGKLLGVSGSAIGNYENGLNSPKADVLFQVFDVLQCDANYLFQDEMNELKTDDISVPEIKMVKKFRELDPHGQQLVTLVIDKELERCRPGPAELPKKDPAQMTRDELDEGIRKCLIAIDDEKKMELLKIALISASKAHKKPVPVQDS